MTSYRREKKTAQEIFIAIQSQKARVLLVNRRQCLINNRIPICRKVSPSHLQDSIGAARKIRCSWGKSNETIKGRRTPPREDRLLMQQLVFL